jgi:hypothetical protein
MTARAGFASGITPANQNVLELLSRSFCAEFHDNAPRSRGIIQIVRS